MTADELTELLQQEFVLELDVDQHQNKFRVTLRRRTGNSSFDPPTVLQSYWEDFPKDRS